MGFARLLSRARHGVDAPPVTIEVFLSGGLPVFSIVGMPETAVRESKDRVRGALLSSGFRFPQQRITVSLGPADMRKTGGRYDLAIAVGILAASGQLRVDELRNYEFYGELALNGEIRTVPGLLPAAVCAEAAGHAMVVPGDNVAEACLAADRVMPARTLLEVVAHAAGDPLLPLHRRHRPAATASDIPDLADVRGQARARRALEIAATGGHNLLLCGPPGTGKSMLARRLPGILPPLTESAALQSLAIESVLGLPFDTSSWRVPPFRAPHHTASAVALVGGGREPRPGEISRAHQGVLFLDELPEFSRHVLEVLREPLETGAITISRAGAQADFPARFQLVAAMNPCPCGYLGDPTGNCNCSADRVRDYRGRISGPLLDRIDLHVQVPRPPPTVLRADAPRAEDSRAVAARVAAGRDRQAQRQASLNAWLDGDALRDACRPTASAERMLEQAAERLGLSVRGYQRTLRVARSIADLADNARVDGKHVAEALSLRAEQSFGLAPAA